MSAACTKEAISTRPNTIAILMLFIMSLSYIRISKLSFLNSNTNLFFVKQVILIRKDLKMGVGKAAAQAAHASVQAVLKSPKQKVDEWEKSGMKKSILKVNSEKELLLYQKKAKKAK